MAAVISLAHQPAPPSRQALDRLKALMGEDLAEVNDVILSRMHSRVPLIPELAGHIIAAGGKRLRPLIVLACARLCGYAGSRHVRLSACVEFIHTATLLHDDVVDDSGLRRGNATANAVWGNQAIVLDTHMSVMEGSISAIPRRVMVRDEHAFRARRLLDAAGIDHDRPSIA